MRPLIRLARRGLVTCVCAAVFLGATAVAPSASAAEDAVVEALIQRGIQLRKSNQDEQALAVFLEAEKQDPSSVRVLLHVVTAAQAAGKWLLADSYMRKVSTMQADPYYQRHADAIEVVRRSIAARVGMFQVQGGPDGASVRLDGQLVGTLPMTTPASIEAGAYMMEVHKPGFYRLRRNVTINGGVLTREPVELNRAVVRSDTNPNGAGAVAGGGDVGVDAGERSWWQSPAVGWSLLGVGVASGAASAVAFITRENRVDRWNDPSCLSSANPNRTRVAECGSLKDEAETAQAVGIVTAIAGVAFTGLGITHLLATGGSSAPESGDSALADRGVRITSCDAGFLSLACRGSF